MAQPSTHLWALQVRPSYWSTASLRPASDLQRSQRRSILTNVGIYGAWGLVVTAIFIHFVVDRLGRRPPLIFGAFLMAVCLAWQAGIGSQFDQGKGTYSKGIAGVASIFMFSWAFSWSYGPVSWVSVLLRLFRAQEPEQGGSVGQLQYRQMQS